MSTFSPKLLKLSALALVALTVSAGTSFADPGKGLRWSDFAFGSSSNARTTRSTPLYAPVVTPIPVATADPSGTPSTITIRGTDGVLRTFQVAGNVSQQLPAQGYVTVRDADGVTRAYPVGNGQPLPAGSVVVPAPTVWVRPHRR